MTNVGSTSLSHIRFLSFDVWGTLLRGHPDFKATRQEIIAHALGVSDRALFARVAHEVDNDIDARSDVTGEDFNFTARVREIASRCGVHTAHLDSTFFASMQAKVNAKYRMLPPSWIEPEIPAILRQLKSLGYTLGLLSNTGFINGAAQREAFAALGVLDLFMVTIFSDEEHLAKPSRTIYERLITRSGVPAKDILHIGDNLFADYCGSSAMGITPLHYDPKQKCEEKVRMITTMRTLPDLLAR